MLGDLTDSAGHQQLLKSINRMSLVRHLCANPDLSRVDLAAAVGLTKSTVSMLVRELIATDGRVRMVRRPLVDQPPLARLKGQQRPTRAATQRLAHRDEFITPAQGAASIAPAALSTSARRGNKVETKDGLMTLLLVGIHLCRDM